MALSLIILVSSYLVGAIPFGVLVTRLLGKGDLREQGSGNSGAFNAYRVLGVVPAALVAALDAGKGFAAAYAGGHFATALYPAQPIVAGIVCGLAAVAGQIWPVYLRRRTVELPDGSEKKVWGGKGLATTAGALAAIAFPILIQVAFGWLLYYLLGPLMSKFMKQGELTETRRIAQASLTAALTLPVFAFFTPDTGILPPRNVAITAALALWTVVLAIPQLPDLAPPPKQVKVTRQMRRDREREKETKAREDEQKRREKEQKRRLARKK